MKNIPFFDYPSIYKRFEGEFNATFQRVCSHGSFILQADLAAFEAELADFLGLDYVLGVSDGTNAISLGLTACGVGHGDEVIVSAHTYIATASAIKSVGATPRLVDIGDDFLISPSSVKRAINSRTKAIMPTQLNGRCSDMNELMKIASDNNLLVFEDAAQAVGARYHGKSAGSFGEFGTFSFYPAKILGCFGDGGAITCRSNDVYERLKALRDHGRDNSGDIVCWGTNSRLDNLQAAFLRIRLEHLPEDLARRRAIARIYDEGLSHIRQLTLPPAPIPSSEIRYDVYQNYEVCAENRDILKEYLNENGVGTIIQWGGKALHHFTNLDWEGSYYGDELANTNKFFHECLMLPMNMAMSDQDAHRIVDLVNDFYNQGLKVG